MTKHHHGFSLIELLIATGITAAVSLSLLGALNHATQSASQVKQTRLAMQIVENITHETLFLSHISSSKQAELETYTRQYLPNATLSIQNHTIHLTWPEAHPIAVNCETQKGYSCVALIA